MAEGGKVWGRGVTWSAEDLAIVVSNQGMPMDELRALLPGKTKSAIANIRYRHVEVPAVKPAGDYVETLNAYFVDYWDCLSIWLRWNGYAYYRELSRDMNIGILGIATLLCTAKE